MVEMFVFLCELLWSIYYDKVCSCWCYFCFGVNFGGSDVVKWFVCWCVVDVYSGNVYVVDDVVDVVGYVVWFDCCVWNLLLIELWLYVVVLVGGGVVFYFEL